MGGTLTFASPHLGVGLASTLQLRLGKDREARRRWGGSSTLLGPEGTGPRPTGCVDVPLGPRRPANRPVTLAEPGSGAWHNARGRWLLENCTVDASIFEVSKILISLVSANSCCSSF